MNKKIYDLYESFLDNVNMAEEIGISVQEFWDTLYKPHLIRLMNEVEQNNPSDESWKIKTKPRKGSGSAPSNKFFPRCEIWEREGEKQHES